MSDYPNLYSLPLSDNIKKILNVPGKSTKPLWNSKIGKVSCAVWRTRLGYTISLRRLDAITECVCYLKEDNSGERSELYAASFLLSEASNFIEADKLKKRRS